MRILTTEAHGPRTNLIIGGAIEVHRHLGPGLLESAYEECLCYELSQAGLLFRRQVSAPVKYKGLNLECCLRLDLIVEDVVIVEIKTVERLAPIHTAQLLTYLKVTNKALGLLMNFNVPILKHGLKRVSNHYLQPNPETKERAEAESLPQRRRDAEEKQSLPITEPESSSPSPVLSQRLCVSAVRRTAEVVSRPVHETKRRAEAESLPQRRRDAEEKQSLPITVLKSSSPRSVLFQCPSLSGVKRTAEVLFQPEHETKERAEAESLPQRRRDAEEAQSLPNTEEESSS